MYCAFKDIWPEIDIDIGRSSKRGELTTYFINDLIVFSIDFDDMHKESLFITFKVDFILKVLSSNQLVRSKNEPSPIETAIVKKLTSFLSSFHNQHSVESFPLASCMST